MQVDWDADARARGAFNGVGEAQFATRNTKLAGSLPLTGANATSFVNTSTSSTQGVWWEFLATGGYDVSTDTKVCIFVFQYNAPNRIEVETKANDGLLFRLGTGSGTPPANYRTFQVGGQDTGLGKAREFPSHVVIDLNNTSQDATTGTFDNTDVQCYGWGTTSFTTMGGSTNMTFMQRFFVFDTTKNATDIPRFTGSGSDWDDVVTAVGTAYTAKITHGWLQREGTVFAIACPIEIGNNSTITTFNDNGASVF